LELWYEFPNRAGGPATGASNADAAFPRIEGARGPSRSYWQLVCPETEHLLWSPAMLTPEMRWAGLAPFRQRQGALSQSDLERWSGATEQPPIPSAANQYLFSAVGGLPEIEFRLVNRRIVLLATAGAVLIAGLLIIHVSALRHPAVLFGAGVALAAMALYNPDVAWRLSQAATVGLALVAVAAFFRASVVRRRQGRVVLQGQSAAAVRVPPGTTSGPLPGAPAAGSGGAPAAPADSRRSHRDSSLRSQPAAAPPTA
jgi:hypothetical protein